MKILALSNLYPPAAIGGYERLVAEVVASLARRGHTLSVLTSDYGDTLRAATEDVQVERSLRLPVPRDNIYAPFPGTAEERERIAAHNRAVVARKIANDKPDALLVGNLYFFDASILDALAPVAARSVLLLTDIWRIHFADPTGLQDYFRKQVFELRPGTPALVPPDPPALPLALASSVPEPERARRRGVEESLAAGRDAFLLRGICHLCGPTTFVVRRAGPKTLVLSERKRCETCCTRCGLGNGSRSALHVLDVLTAGAARPENSLLCVEDASARFELASRFPAATVVTASDDANGSFDHGVYVGDGPFPARLIGKVRGTVVAVGAEPEGAGFTHLSCWSEQYGYLGPDPAVHALSR